MRPPILTIAAWLFLAAPAVAGRRAIRAYFQECFAAFARDHFALAAAEIEVAGSWAFRRGAFGWRGRPRTGGDSVEDHGTYLIILRRQRDGSWKVYRDVGNSGRPPSQR